jgi:OmcA/MtrC family decaheme c-type cytochrome
MSHRVHAAFRFSVIICILLAASVAIQSRAASPATFNYNILSVRGVASADAVAPGDFVVVTFSVTNPQTGTAYDLRLDPAWTQTTSGASRLFLQVAWNTADITNTESNSNSVPGGRGAAMPIPINALGPSLLANGDGTYEVRSPLPVPATASGSGVVAMEGHPAGPDASGALTVRVPVKSVYATFRITDTTAVPRRQIVSADRCMGCHRSDGSGAAPQLTLHGNNRTEEPQVCVVCHNPNNTDIVFRLATDPKVVIGSRTYPEQSLDFKRLVHGIHASSKGFRRNPLVVIGFNHTVFDASTLTPYPRSLRDCTACHLDNGRQGTFELPLARGVLGPTFNTSSFNADGTVTIDTNPSNDVKISPIASVCSSCHDDRETLSHMVATGGASFNTDLPALIAGSVRERCPACHGPGREKSVRRVHLSHDD